MAGKMNKLICGEGISVYWLISNLLKPLLILTILAGIAGGIFLFLKPAQAIDIQKKFYEKINWRMEPISLSKEIKNTMIMGLFLIAICLAAIIYTILKAV